MLEFINTFRIAILHKFCDLEVVFQLQIMVDAMRYVMLQMCLFIEPYFLGLVQYCRALDIK